MRDIKSKPACSLLGTGIFDLTSSIALSINIPVGSPFSSFNICPPSGSGVSRVIPAISSAFELATIECSPARLATTGLFGLKGSRSSLFKKRPSCHFFSIHPTPTIHSPSGVASTRSRILLTVCVKSSIP